MNLQLMKKVFLMAGVLSVAVFGNSYGQAGMLDSTFGVNGKAIQAIDSVTSGMEKIELQQDGKIIVGGALSRDNYLNFALFRCHTDGTLDSTFGVNGFSVLHVGTGNDEVASMVIQPDNKILIGGYSYINSVTYWTVARFNPNGAIDSSFADNGVKILDLNGANNIAVRTDGKIIISTQDGPNHVAVLTRLNLDGSLDTGFGSLGNIMAPDDGHFTSLYDMALQPDNKIIGLASSDTTGYPLTIVRFKQDGTPDSTFGINGYVKTDLNFGAVFSDILLQPDNKIVVFCNIPLGGGVVKGVILRLNPDGNLDANFGTGGKTMLSPGNNLQISYNMSSALQDDGKIVLAGAIYYAQSAASGSKDNFLLARLNSNGTLDNEFGNSGYVTTNFDSANDGIPTALFVVDDGKLLAGGVSIFPYSHPSNTVFARYNSCGISISGQPSDQTKGLDATATFMVGSTSPSAGYQWQTKNTTGWANLNDGGQYSGTQTHSLHVAGLTLANDQQGFRAIALSGACSDTSASALLTVDTSLGISEIDRAAGFRVYPNPVNDQLTITAKSLSDNITAMRVTDLLGKTIIHRKITGKATTTLSTKSWPVGIYIVEVSLNGKAPQVIKVVKEN